MRAGVVARLLSKIVDPELQAAINKGVAVLRSLGVDVRDVELPAIPEGTFGALILAESYVFHAPLLASAADRYQPVIRRRAEFGKTIDTTSYIKARRDMEQLRRVVGRVFADVDVLLAPTSYASPSTIEQESKREQEVGAPPALPTVDFSIYGLPTISVPCGFTSSGLPIGFQISGPRFGEAKILALAHAYERATNWHTERPML
jgi:aspartyl-tRNA(Asn)/glutamyl-tRNA(Gln) amidotransferase subunit A